MKSFYYILFTQFRETLIPQHYYKLNFLSYHEII